MRLLPIKSQSMFKLKLAVNGLYIVHIAKIFVGATFSCALHICLVLLLWHLDLHLRGLEMKFLGERTVLVLQQVYSQLYYLRQRRSVAS
jgi:hypothetical protein